MMIRLTVLFLFLSSHIYAQTDSTLVVITVDSTGERLKKIREVFGPIFDHDLDYILKQKAALEKVEIYTDITKKEKLTTAFLKNIIHQNSLSQVIDNYVDDAHVHLETTADYDKPNPYHIAFTGASYKWTKHHYDNIRINNPLIAGDASYHFTLENNDLSWDSHQGSIFIKSNKSGNKSLSVRGLTGAGLGDRVGFTDWFLNNISGHRSAGERAIFDIQQRPHTSWHSEITYTDTNRESPFYFNISGGSRVHVDQDYAGTNTSYEEEYLQILAAGKLIKKRNILGEGVNYIFRYSERDHFGGEYQYNHDETSKLIQLASTIYTKKQIVDGGYQTIALHINALRKAPININFSRNIIDQDGEGIYPYHQDGRQQSFGLHFKRNENILPSISLELEANNTLILHSPSDNLRQNAIYRQSNADNYISLHTIQWAQEGFSSGLLENSATVNYKKQSDNQSLSFSGGLHLYGLLVREKNLISIGISTDISWQRKLSKKWHFGAKLGFYPNKYDIDQVRLLSKDYLNGIARYWNDTNNDKLAQENELGATAFTTGGAHNTTSDDLGLSYTYYLDVPITYVASKQWKWTLMAQYRQYRGTWTMEYDRPASEYGEFSNIGDRSLWFATGGEQRYIVQPLSSERMNTGREGSSFLFDQPFYGGVTFRFEHQSKRWFFTGSMTANMIVGYAGLGNGPLHNNINAPSETTANPNTLVNQIGRLDTDRSFISRMVANYKYSKDGSIGITLKYKDGQSFAYYEHYIKEQNGNKEIAFYQPEVRGDHPLTGERGRREDFFTNFELHGQHRFKVGKGSLQVRMTLHNLLDFANETSEYIYGNVEGFSRSPLELQVPRSASIEISYLW